MRFFYALVLVCCCCVNSVVLRGEKSLSEMRELREGLDRMTKTLIEKRSKQLLRSRLSKSNVASEKMSPYPVSTDPVTSGDSNLPKESERFADSKTDSEADSEADSEERAKETKNVLETTDENKDLVKDDEGAVEQKKIDDEEERFAEQKVKAEAAPWWLNPPPWWLPPPAEWGQPPATIYSDFYTSPHFKNGNYPASYPVYNPYPLSR